MGLGYIPPFTGSKNLRDTEHGVRIEFLIAGEFPGDGKPKPVAFPDPAEAGVEIRRRPLSDPAEAGRAEAGLGNDRRASPPQGLRRRDRPDRDP